MNIPKDKLLHFFVGTWISFTLIAFFGGWGAIASVLIFAAKEVVYDGLMKKGKMEFKDFFMSALPALMLYVLTL